MIRRIVVATILLVATAVVLTACGGSGGPSISAARSCLKDAHFDLQGPQGADAGKVQEGVSGTYGLGAGTLDPDKPLTIVVAANVKKQSYVDSFVKESKSFTSQLSAAQKKSFDVHSGHDGKYVWVVAGAKGSKQFAAAEKCIKP